MVNSPGLDMARPRLRFTPPQGWINDPNGLVYVDGVWHLFYQHNPGDIVWGDIHWGHATSTDLVSWEHHDAAIRPSPVFGVVASGCAVMDHDNTSGLGDGTTPPVVALFSHFPPNEAPQIQSLAWSGDRGATFTEWRANPIIDNPGIKDFRDPKVIRHEDTGRWLMVLAAGDHVQLYTSTDLLSWDKLQEWGQEHGSHVGIWECPDLFPMTVSGTGETVWVLLVSVNDGAPCGGSGTQVFLGSVTEAGFSRRAGTPADQIDWLEHGPDSYAGVTFSDAPAGRRVLLAWMSNWAYADKVPATHWRGSMTAPRDLRVIDDNGVPKATLGFSPEVFSAVSVPTDAPSDPCFRAQLVLPPGEAVAFGGVVLRRSLTGLELDTTATPAVPGRPLGPFRAPLGPAESDRVDVLVDVGSIEVIAAQGRAAFTALVDATATLTAVVPSAGAQVQLFDMGPTA